MHYCYKFLNLLFHPHGDNTRQKYPQGWDHIWLLHYSCVFAQCTSLQCSIRYWTCNTANLRAGYLDHLASLWPLIKGGWIQWAKRGPLNSEREKHFQNISSSWYSFKFILASQMLPMTWYVTHRMYYECGILERKYSPALEYGPIKIHEPDQPYSHVTEQIIGLCTSLIYITQFWFHPPKILVFWCYTWLLCETIKM